jgi:hypothetical protein
MKNLPKALNLSSCFLALFLVSGVNLPDTGSSLGTAYRATLSGSKPGEEFDQSDNVFRLLARLKEFRTRFDQGQRVAAITDAEAFCRENPTFVYGRRFFMQLLLENSEFARRDAFEYEFRDTEVKDYHSLRRILWHCRRNSIEPKPEWLQYARSTTQYDLKRFGYKKSIGEATVEQLTDFNDLVEIKTPAEYISSATQYQKDYVNIVFERLPNHPVVFGLKMRQDLRQNPKRIESAIANYHGAVANRKNLPEWEVFFGTLETQISRYLPRPEFKRSGKSVPLPDPEAEVSQTGLNRFNPAVIVRK